MRPAPFRASHVCPGGCRRQVRDDLFACRNCWFRLPNDIRHAINHNYRRNPDAHQAAMSAAVEWYADHEPR